MRKINKISNIALIFMLIGIFLSQSFAYSHNTSKLRNPLNAINNERADEARDVLVQKSASMQPARKIVFSWSFNAEKDRVKIKEIADSLINELERKLRERIIAFDEIGIRDSCYELAFNIMMHGNGGSITINYMQEKNGIEVIGIDVGEGMENPNELLQQSIRAYAKWVEYDMGITEEEPPPHGGYGFRNIVIFPEEVTIETRGVKWIKVGTEEKELALQRAGSSDIEKGTKITLVWPILQNPIPAQHHLLADSEEVKNRLIAPLIKQSFPDAHNISFADLDTGTGEFVTNFTAYLKRHYENAEGIGVELLGSLVEQARANGHNVVHGTPEVEGGYEKAGLTDNSKDMVTINKIETRPLALIAQADRILKQNGLIIVTFEINDIQEKLGIDELVENNLEERGYLVERIPFPNDYPHSVELQEADFILIGRKNGEGLIFRQTMSCL